MTSLGGVEHGCMKDSKAVDIAAVQVDKCKASVDANPLQILSQDKSTVEYRNETQEEFLVTL